MIIGIIIVAVITILFYVVLSHATSKDWSSED